MKEIPRNLGSNLANHGILSVWKEGILKEFTHLYTVVRITFYNLSIVSVLFFLVHQIRPPLCIA